MESNNRVLLLVGLLIIGALVFSAYSSEITGAVILGNQVTCSPGNIRGDLDSNNRLTRGDVTNLQRVLSGRYTVSGDNCCVDVNNDGSVSSSDVDELRRVRSGAAQASRCVVSSAPTSPSSGAATSCDGDGVCEALSLTTKRLEVTNPQGPALFYGGSNQDFEIRVPTDFRESVGFNGDVELNKNVKIGLFNNLPVLETKGNPGAHTLKVNGGVMFEEDVEFRDDIQVPVGASIGNLKATAAEIGLLTSTLFRVGPVTRPAFTVVTTSTGSPSQVVVSAPTQFENRVIFNDVQRSQNPIVEIRETTHAGPAQMIVSSPASFHDTLVISTLSGQGNAYACLDSNGKLFRSNTPCR